MLVALIVVSSTISLKNRPIRMIHYINPFCQALYQGHGGKCIEVAKSLDSFFKSNEVQAAVACKKFTAEISNLKDGFHIVTYTFAGFVVRTMLHTCPEIAKLVRRVVFVNVPHMGLDKVPDIQIVKKLQGTREEILSISADDVKASIPILTKPEAAIIHVGLKAVIGSNIHRMEEGQLLLKHLVDGKPVPKGHEWISNAGMTEIVKANGAFHAYLNDVNSAKYASIYAQLELVMNIKSLHDNLNTPSNTVMLGSDIDKSGGITDFEKTPMYTSHSAGFGELYKTGRLVNCLSISAPEFLKHAESKAIYRTLLTEDSAETTSAGSAKKQLQKFLKEYPQKCAGKF